MIICAMTLEHHPVSWRAVLPSTVRSLCSDRPNLLSASVPRSLLCFHILTNSFFRSSFLLTFIQTAGGYTPLDEQLSEPILEATLANSSRANTLVAPSAPHAAATVRWRGRSRCGTLCVHLLHSIARHLRFEGLRGCTCSLFCLTA